MSVSRFHLVHLGFARGKAKALHAACRMKGGDLARKTLSECQSGVAAMLGYQSWSELKAVTESKGFPPSPLDERAGLLARTMREVDHFRALEATWDIATEDAIGLVRAVRPTAGGDHAPTLSDGPLTRLSPTDFAELGTLADLEEWVSFDAVDAALALVGTPAVGGTVADVVDVEVRAATYLDDGPAIRISGTFSALVRDIGPRSGSAPVHGSFVLELGPGVSRMQPSYRLVAPNGVFWTT